MADIEKLLYEYLLLIKPTEVSKDSGENQENNVEQWDIHNCFVCEDNWKIFKELSFDVVQLKAHFNLQSEEERAKIFKLGVACLITFIRCNSTGPSLEKDIEDFLKSDVFSDVSFKKLLSVNNEEININCQFPALLLTAKIIFEWCLINNIINNWWYWRSILIHQEILDELSPTLLSDADRLYRQFQPHINFKGMFKIK